MVSQENNDFKPKSSNAKDKCNQTGESVRDGEKFGKLRADHPSVSRDVIDDNEKSNKAMKKSGACETSELIPGPGSYPYQQVLALLFLWEEEDLGNGKGIGLLKRVLRRRYNFDVEVYHIPSENCMRAIETKLEHYRQLCMEKKTLLIVYYAGHGGYRPGSGLKFSLFRRMPDDPWPVNRDKTSIAWKPLQKRLEGTNSDVLVILDCCDAAGAIDLSPTNKSHRMELIVASGAPGTGWAKPSHKNLTITLIEELKQRTSTNHVQTFTAASLYNSILRKTVNKSYSLGKPCLNCTTKPMRPYQYPSPIYFNLNEAVGATSICIKPLKRKSKVASPKGIRRIQGSKSSNTVPRNEERRIQDLPEAREGECE